MSEKIDGSGNAEINNIRFVQQMSHPSSPSSGHELLYMMSGTAHGGLFVKTSDGKQIGPFITGTSGGSLTSVNLGYTSVGGTSDSLSQSKYVAKPVTPSTSAPIRSIVLHIAGNGSGNIQPMCAIYDDNGGAPGKLVAWGTMSALFYGPVLSSTARWLYMSIYYIPTPSSQIWIVAGAVTDAAGETVLYYDTGGGDYNIVSTTVLNDGGFSTTSGRNYSLYAIQEG